MVNYTTGLNNIASENRDKSSPIEKLIQRSCKVRAIGGFNWDPYDWFLNLWSSWDTIFFHSLNTNIQVKKVPGQFKAM